jgi:DNA-binding GntR family transcriptional regulator
MAIETRDVTEQVYEQVEAMILDGTLVQGSRIPQEHLAKELGISRTILLKALYRLEHELLLESIPRRGMFVRQIGTNEIIDSLEIRIGVESVAVRLLARDITNEQLDELHSYFSPFNGSSDQFDKKTYALADRMFHLRILQMTGNPILEKMKIIGNILFLAGAELWWPAEISLQEHLDIINALAEHDSERAANAMKRHLRNSLDNMKQVYAEPGMEIQSIS